MSELVDVRVPTVGEAAGIAEVGGVADVAGITRVAGAEPGRLGIPTRMLIGLVRTYQLARSGRVSPCRFTPTCSHYAVEAVTRHGARRGLSLTARRLGRCRPGGPSGFDPVPE